MWFVRLGMQIITALNIYQVFYVALTTCGSQLFLKMLVSCSRWNWLIWFCLIIRHWLILFKPHMGLSIDVYKLPRINITRRKVTIHCLWSLSEIVTKTPEIFSSGFCYATSKVLDLWARQLDWLSVHPNLTDWTESQSTKQHRFSVIE